MGKEKKWELAESNALAFLRNTYGDCAEFIEQGGSNAKVSDILVQVDGNDMFYIEVKKIPSQAGQFTLIDDGEQFIISRQSVDLDDLVMPKICEVMNKHYSEIIEAHKYRVVQNDLDPFYSNSAVENDIINLFHEDPDEFDDDDIMFLSDNTLGTQTALDLQEFALEGVKQHYRKKGAAYILTTYGDCTAFDLISIEDISADYFTCSIGLRYKSSGHVPIGINHQEEILNAIETLYGINRECTYMKQVRGNSQDLFVHLDSPDWNKVTFSVEKGDKIENFIFSHKGQDENGNYIYVIGHFTGRFAIAVIYSLDFSPYANEVSWDPTEFEYDIGCPEYRWYNVQNNF